MSKHLDSSGLRKSFLQDLELTLMERQINLHGGQSVVRMLTTQYRMNGLIMQWSSDALYEGRVCAGDNVVGHVLADLPMVSRCELTETVLLLIDTCGADMVEFSTMDGISKGNMEFHGFYFKPLPLYLYLIYHYLPLSSIIIY